MTRIVSTQLRDSQQKRAGRVSCRLLPPMEREALVVVNDASVTSSWRSAHVVRTMLDMIEWLERAANSFVTVVLSGAYAEDDELVRFLREAYPSAQVLAGAHALECN